MIPLRDVIPSRTTPFVTVGLIIVNALAFLYQAALPPDQFEVFILGWGLVPAHFSVVTLLTSMFLHGGWLHFLGNMLYLWIFGDNVEDRFGHGRYLVFYLLCGALAALAQVVTAPSSTVPMVGASGAIAGVLGAYLVMFPHSRVLTLVPIVFFIQIIEVPATVLLGLWFVLQLVSGIGALSVARGSEIGGVAFWAHAAGFASGMALVWLFRRRERERVEWWDM